jgi:hypothetical protein|tara:strand:+ start:1010 stop:1216 length:207 start_codon:yes stop_codon:yes gene_type:complete
MSIRNIEGNKMYEELLEELDACKTFSEQALSELKKTDLKNDKELIRMIEKINQFSEDAYDWTKDEALG